jgi:hypothetical protein
VPDIAIVSVLTTGVVGLAAAVMPAITRYADRKHERVSKEEDNVYKRREQYWTLRESFYLDLISACVNVMDILEHFDKGRDGKPPEVIAVQNIGPRMIAYASDPVRELYQAFANTFAVLTGRTEPSEDALELAKVTELNEDNWDACWKRWMSFIEFVYDRLIDQIQGELSSGQIYMKGIGEPVEYDVIKTYLARTPKGTPKKLKN